MRRNIEIANGQVDYVSKALQITISGSPVFDDFDNTVKALANVLWIRTKSECRGLPVFLRYHES